MAAGGGAGAAASEAAPHDSELEDDVMAAEADPESDHVLATGAG